MNTTVSPSEVAVRATGKRPVKGRVATSAGACALCGTQHAKGDPVMPYPRDPQAIKSFTDWPNLRAPQSDTLCIWCHCVWCVPGNSRPFTQKYLKTVMCSSGVFPAASNNHLAYWLLNPPKPPWIFLQGDQQRQHVVWRSPVNTRQDVFQIRAGEQLLTIRVQSLRDGLKACEVLTAALNDKRSKGKRGAPYKSPFIVLSRDRDRLDQGTLRKELHEWSLTDPQIAAHVETLMRLTYGERWALTALLYAKEPQRPDPIVKPITH